VHRGGRVRAGPFMHQGCHSNPLESSIPTYSLSVPRRRKQTQDLEHNIFHPVWWLKLSHTATLGVDRRKFGGPDKACHTATVVTVLSRTHTKLLLCSS